MKKCIALLIVILFLPSCVGRGTYKRAIREIDSLKDKVKYYEEKTEELREMVYTLEDEKKELEEQVEMMEDIIERAKTRCRLWSDDAYMALYVLNEY